MGQNRKNMSGHFLVHGRKWTAVDAVRSAVDTFFKSHNNITNRSGTHTNNVFYVFCRKLTLVVVQNTSGHFLVHGRWWTLVDAVDAVDGTPWTLFFEMSQKSQITLQNVYRLCRAMFYVENKPSVWFKLVQTV